MFLQKDERVWAEVRLWEAHRIEARAEDGGSCLGRKQTWNWKDP